MTGCMSQSCDTPVVITSFFLRFSIYTFYPSHLSFSYQTRPPASRMWHSAHNDPGDSRIRAYQRHQDCRINANYRARGFIDFLRAHSHAAHICLSRWTKEIRENGVCIEISLARLESLSKDRETIQISDLGDLFGYSRSYVSIRFCIYSMDGWSD